MDFQEVWNDTCSQVGLAARTGEVAVLNTLLRKKRPVDVADNRGWRPLHEAAATSPTIECLEILLKHGGSDINWTTHERETALLLACKRRQGSNANAFVDLLLQYGADPNISDNEEDSPLLEALRSSNLHVVECLLAAGANVNAADCSVWSPLHEAATKQDPEFLKCLLNSGAIINVQDECGMTPIFTAAQHGCTQCLEELLKTIKERNQLNVVNIGAEDWATPLMIAAQQGFINCVKLLLDYGANPDLKTCDNATALHLAAQGNKIDCLEMVIPKMNLERLISEFHPDGFVKSSDMVSPLHLAIEWSSHEALRVLLKAGFSPNSMFSCHNPSFSEVIPYLPANETAVTYAVLKNNREALNILLAAGASYNPVNRSAYHPLVAAMFQIDDSTMFDFLIECGADVNYQRRNTPTNEVFLFSLMSDFKYTKRLLHYGCDPNLCFQVEEDINTFLRCTRCCLRRNKISLHEFLKFLSRFLIVSNCVQLSFQGLRFLFPEEDISDILDRINQPSPLKQICAVKLRQFLYSVHGVKLPTIISLLKLPPVLSDYVACSDVL